MFGRDFQAADTNLDTMRTKIVEICSSMSEIKPGQACDAILDMMTPYPSDTDMRSNMSELVPPVINREVDTYNYKESR